MRKKELNLYKFAKEVHENAVNHGWWDGDRSYAEICALIHSEWSEALEEYRSDKPMAYKVCTAGVEFCDCDGHPHADQHSVCVNDKKCIYRQPKPEGIAVELIDGCIRILDYLGMVDYLFFPLDIRSRFNLISEHRKEKINTFSLPELIAKLHVCVSESYTYSTLGEIKDAYEALDEAMIIACYWLMKQGVDVESIMLEKHEYNKNRPYRHGGKKI